MRNRVDDWQAKLFAALDEPVELIYGQTDCLLHSCEVVQRLTGIDYADGLRGTYSSEEEAKVIIEKVGNISGYLTQRIGQPLEHVMQAQAGDLVLLVRDEVEVLGVCTGWKVAFINHPPGKGIRSVRLELCNKAWST